MPFNNMNRRDFLKASGILGVGAASGAALPLTGALAFDKDLNKVTRTHETMGTFATITVMHPSKAKADDAIGKAFAEMDRVAGLLTRYDSASPVSVLNRDGVVRSLDREVLDVFAQAGAFHKATGGLFDITVCPVVDLYKKSFEKTGAAPAKREMARAVKLVDGGAVRISGRDIAFARKGMSATLDGIAKGYVIDAGALALKKAGIKHALVNAGGDIRAIGGKGNQRAWTVAVRNPQANKPFVDKVKLKDGAVATSGNYEVFFDREKLFHHIVSPQKGMSPAEAASVTVKAPSVTVADALSTAVFVMGPEQGTRFIDTKGNIQSLVVDRRGRITASKGWKSA